MQRPKRQTKKERKAEAGGPRPASAPAGGVHHNHIHCTGCGAHLDGEQFGGEPPDAVWLTCDHGSTFAACSGCVGATRRLLEEHDRTGQPVKAAQLWH